MPNLPDPDVPVGSDDSANVVLQTVGEPRAFDFEPKPHWDLGPALGILDFERGVKITGSRFYVLSGAGARLQRALIAWMLDLHVAPGLHREVHALHGARSRRSSAPGNCPKFARQPLPRCTKRICGWCRRPKSR